MAFIFQIKSERNGKKKYIDKEELKKYRFDNTEYLLGGKIIMDDESIWYVCGYGDSEMVQRDEE